MSEHTACIHWQREGRPFERDRYSRDHEWRRRAAYRRFGGTGVIGQRIEGRSGRGAGGGPVRPRIAFADGGPHDAQALRRLHEQAHAHCFIANPVRCRIAIEPR
jgi:hypothetical protein